MSALEKPLYFSWMLCHPLGVKYYHNNWRVSVDAPLGDAFNQWHLRHEHITYTNFNSAYFEYVFSSIQVIPR